MIKVYETEDYYVLHDTETEACVYQRKREFSAGDSPISGYEKMVIQLCDTITGKD